MSELIDRESDEAVRARLKELRSRYFRSNNAEMARAAGMDPSTLLKAVNGDTKEVSSFVIDRVAEIEIDGQRVRAPWVEKGEGEMLAPASGDGARVASSPAPAEAEARTQATEVMELDVTTGGGNGGVAIQERPIARYEVDYIPLSDLRGRHPDDAFATRMIGRSMTPELQPNDRIVVQPYPEGAQRIETDAIYVFRIDGEIQVKQLEWKPGKRLVCKALSKNHDGFDLDLSDDGPIAEGDIDFAIIGRVWGHFCLL
jgi:phage repressor protein C with HTH and peptisase S24 domain